MQRAGIFLLSLTASLLMLAVAHGEDASERFLQGWQDFSSGENLEREAQPAEALAKYRSAAVVFEKIAADQPDWQPLVVQYRLKKTRENITRLEPLVASLASSSQANPEGPLPQAERSSVTPEISSIPLGIAINTPRNLRQSRQNVTADSSSIPQTAPSDPDDVRTLRKQLLAVSKERDRLNKKVLGLTAELQSARMEVDRTKVTVVELRSQAEQASAALKNAQFDEKNVDSRQKDLEKQLAEAGLQITNLAADNEVLSEENNHLRGKLDLAAKYIAGSDTIRQGLLKERRELADARDTAVARTKKIKDNTAQIEKITAENQKVTSENRELKDKVAEFEKSYVKRAEVEKLAAQNKELEEKLQLAERNSVSKKEWEKLAAEKSEIETKYQEAQQRLTEATTANPEKEKLLISLQSELNSVNDRLLEAQGQYAHSQNQIRDLQRQLDETSGELARLKINGSVKEQQTLAAENELLRGIIFRQIKEQTNRDEARKILEQEIATLQIKSEVISRQLATLGAPVLQLTPEEKALFKQPISLINESAPQAMEVNLAMTKQTPGEPSSADQNLSSVPENIRADMDTAKQLFASKDYLGAEKIYQQIVEETPDNYIILSNLGAVQIEAGKFSAAEVALRKATSINPADASAFTYLGVAYSRQAKFDEAISVLRQAIAINDNNAVAHNYLGVSLAQKEPAAPADAEKEFKRAIELNPDYPEAHFNLAVFYVNGKPPALELARLHYDKATQLGAVPDPSIERLIQ